MLVFCHFFYLCCFFFLLKLICTSFFNTLGTLALCPKCRKHFPHIYCLHFASLWGFTQPQHAQLCKLCTASRLVRSHCRHCLSVLILLNILNFKMYSQMPVWLSHDLALAIHKFYC